MKYSEIKKTAIDRLTKELFKPKGFKLRKGGLGGGFGYYNDSFENRILRIGCGISLYGENSIVRHVSGGINFREIEEIFVPIVVKHGLMGTSLKVDSNATIGIEIIPNFIDKDYSRYRENITIADESGIEILVERFKEYYQEIAAPAFEAFTSIEQFVPLMENLDFYDFTKNFGMGSQFKKAIVWRICNRPDYNEYMQDLLFRTEKFLGPNRDQMEGYKWYNTAIELKEILDKTIPKYNI
jgi:hypothetical protein